RGCMTQAGVQPANFSLEAEPASRDVLWTPARLVYFQYLCDDTPLMLRVTLREFVGRIMAFHGTMITAASLVRDSRINGAQCFPCLFMHECPLALLIPFSQPIAVDDRYWLLWNVFLTRAVKDDEMKKANEEDFS